MDAQTRELPDCPKCKGGELWLWHVGYLFRLHCHRCGWDSKLIGQVGAIDDAIAHAVAFWQCDKSATKHERGKAWV